MPHKRFQPPTPPKSPPRSNKPGKMTSCRSAVLASLLKATHFGTPQDRLTRMSGVDQSNSPPVCFLSQVKQSKQSSPTRDKNVNTHVQIPFFGGPFGLLTTQTTRNGGKKVRSQVLGWTNPPFPQTLHIYISTIIFPHNMPSIPDLIHISTRDEWQASLSSIYKTLLQFRHTTVLVNGAIKTRHVRPINHNPRDAPLTVFHQSFDSISHEIGKANPNMGVCPNAPEA